MKVYKMTLMFLDFDNVGPDGAKSLIENARLPNRIDPGSVMELEEREIGEWEDENPLNSGTTKHKAFKELFK